MILEEKRIYRVIWPLQDVYISSALSDIDISAIIGGKVLRICGLNECTKASGFHRQMTQTEFQGVAFRNSQLSISKH